MTSTSDSNFEDFFLSPVSDDQYARRMKQTRDSFRFFKHKYGKIGTSIAIRNFKVMFSETGNGLSHDSGDASQ